MASIQNLEFELQDLYKEKKYSEIIFEITSKTKESERNAGLFVLLGISRISINKQDKDVVSLAVSDFKKGYLKEKESVNGLNALTNFIISSSILSDFENIDVDFNELISFYESSPKSFQDKREINVAMTMVYKRLNDSKGMLFHLEKIIKSENFTIADLCSYGYWRCFDKNWSQSDFYKFGKFLDDNLNEYSQDQVIKLPNKKNKKIKIGLLSSDIRGGHSVTYFLKTILLNYDKDKFEIFLFLNQIKEDQTSNEFINLVKKSINIGKLDNIKALNTIREFDLDIMIDLMGYTSMQRIELFKNRMAKKQVLWMGYCNTTGVKNMDYIMSDPNLIYKNEKNLYSEEIIYLPEIWNCHSGFNLKRVENPPPIIKNSFITFGSFNSLAKVNETVIDCWSNILKNIKKSKLIIKSAKEKNSLDRLKESFKKKGVLDSVIFYSKINLLEDHLKLYKKIDIALDTFPYNGVTTSFEAIWMGVPVITMAGYNFNSRCGESINKNLNMNFLIAKNNNEYISKAVELSSNLDKYLKLRKQVYEKSLKSPLFDAESYSKNFYKSLEEIIK